MQTAVLSKFSNLLLALYRQAQELPVDEFQDSILSVIKPYLPFDTSMWGTATMTDSGIDIHSLHLHNTTSAMIEAYEKVKHIDAAAARVTQQPTATVAFNTNTDFPGPELKDLRQFLHDFKHENFLITSDINPITRFVHWVSLYRSDPMQLCTEEETELLANLAPHLMQALAINRLVHLDRLTGDTARESWSVAIADSRGVLYHTDKKFKELMQREWAVKNAERLPPGLLQALLGEVDYFTGRLIIVRRNLEHGLLFLKARERHAVDALSAREFLVARLLTSGLTHKQVAAKLERSPDTIRSQVKTIFEKLGINHVAMLAPLLVLRE